MISWFIEVIVTVIVIYQLVLVGYALFFAVAGSVLSANDVEVLPSNLVFKKIAVLIPAYREDSVIVSSVLANLKQDYPTNCYDLFVLADSFQTATLERLKLLPVHVIEVAFESSSVAQSLRKGIEALPTHGDYEFVLISDADNHLAPDFLSRLNAVFAQGWQAVQGHRTAKNLNTPIAVLDAASEEINNHIFRKGHSAVGLSPALTGSGMAFSYELLKAYLFQAREIGGYDKELEMFLRQKRIKIAYLDKAIVLDEKVQRQVVLQQQRTRWIEAQIKHLGLYFVKGFTQLWQGNWDYVNKVFHFLIPPRILLLGSIVLGFIISLFLRDPTFISIFIIDIIGLSVAFAVSIPASIRRLITFREILFTLPAVFITFIISTLNYRKAREKFIHTPHGVQ